MTETKTKTEVMCWPQVFLTELTSTARQSHARVDELLVSLVACKPQLPRTATGIGVDREKKPTLCPVLTQMQPCVETALMLNQDDSSPDQVEFHVALALWLPSVREKV